MSDQNDREIDEFSGVETTGHEWDGIRELNNPLPKWWLWTFYACIIYSIGYMIWYPSIPLIETSTAGISGTTVRSQLKDTLAEVEASREGIRSRILDSDLETIRTDDDLFRFAVAGGGSLYQVNCSQCHGSGAQGGPGYPNLSDDAWIWGGDLESIYLTIKHGVRNEEDDDARFSLMPAFGADELLEKDEINAITAHVLKLADREHDAALAGIGAELYLDNCADCHGEDGKGGRDFGAPNLSDALWLYGGERDEVYAQIVNPKHGVMPPWGERLGEMGVKQLAVYIHSLGGGEQASE